MNRRVSVSWCFLLTLFLAWGVADASPILSDSQRALLVRIDNHINQQTTMQSRFVQVHSNGGYLEGVMYWNRPDQARFEYDPPTPLILLATGTFLVEVDTELEQVTHLPQSGTVADYLLGENFLQNPELVIDDVFEGVGIIRVALHIRDDPDAGRVTLQFSDRTLNLQRWEIRAPDETFTTVSLIDPRYNLELDDDIFYFRRPKEWDAF